MPYASKSQEHLMEGIAHGWKPTDMKHPPSKAVADKFHSEDKAARKKRMMVAALRRQQKADEP